VCTDKYLHYYLALKYQGPVNTANVESCRFEKKSIEKVENVFIPLSVIGRVKVFGDSGMLFVISSVCQGQARNVNGDLAV